VQHHIEGMAPKTTLLLESHVWVKERVKKFLRGEKLRGKNLYQSRTDRALDFTPNCIQCAKKLATQSWLWRRKKKVTKAPQKGTELSELWV